MYASSGFHRHLFAHYPNARWFGFVSLAAAAAGTNSKSIIRLRSLFFSTHVLAD
jgi:hypothetical protein